MAVKEYPLFRAERQKLFISPVDETHLGRVCFSVATNTRTEMRDYLRGFSAKDNKDVIEIVLDSFFEDTLQAAIRHFKKFSDLITEKEFLDGFLLLTDWNKDLDYPTIYDIVLDSVEQWQKYHYTILPGPSKDTWLALLSDKIKWPKDRLAYKPFLRNNKRIWYPFVSLEELAEYFKYKEKFLQVGSLQLPERIYFDSVYEYKGYFEHLADKRGDTKSRRGRYLCHMGRRTLPAWKDMATNKA